MDDPGSRFFRSVLANDGLEIPLYREGWLLLDCRDQVVVLHEQSAVVIDPAKPSSESTSRSVWYRLGDRSLFRAVSSAREPTYEHLRALLADGLAVEQRLVGYEETNVVVHDWEDEDEECPPFSMIPLTKLKVSASGAVSKFITSLWWARDWTTGIVRGASYRYRRGIDRSGYYHPIGDAVFLRLLFDLRRGERSIPTILELRHEGVDDLYINDYNHWGSVLIDNLTNRTDQTANAMWMPSSPPRKALLEESPTGVFIETEYPDEWAEPDMQQLAFRDTAWFLLVDEMLAPLQGAK